MTIYNKPDTQIFAKEAKQGEITSFPDLERGWGVTIATTNGIPPMEYFNAIQNRTDQALAYLMQRGVAEWREDLEYPKFAITILNGQVFFAKEQNIAKNPLSNPDTWVNSFAEKANNSDVELVKNEGVSRWQSNVKYTKYSIVTSENGDLYKSLKDDNMSDIKSENWELVDNLYLDVAKFRQDGDLSDDLAIDRAVAKNKNGVLLFSNNVFKIRTHKIIKNRIKVVNSTFDVLWTPTSWLTIYSRSAQHILPEWFGAVPSRSVDDKPSRTQAELNSKAIQAALDTAIDISIDPIGSVPLLNHDSYNSVVVEFNNGAEYYISNTIKIRSEHHFLGVELRGSGAPEYAGGCIAYDDSLTMFEVEHPKNDRDIGAQTNKRFIDMSIRGGNIGILIQNSDQSNYIQRNRFGTFKEAAIKAYGCFLLDVSSNMHVDAGGGWLLHAEFCNQLNIHNNITGEALNTSKGFFVRPGEAWGGISIHDNILRGGYIRCEADSRQHSKNRVQIKDNTLVKCVSRHYPEVIYVNNNLLNADIDGNCLTCDSEETELSGITFFRGNCTGGQIIGAFKIGVNMKDGGVLSASVNGAKIGYVHKEVLSFDTPLTIIPDVQNCGLGLDINRKCSITGGRIYNCELGINFGGGSLRDTIVSNVYFSENTEDFKMPSVSYNRTHELPAVIDCVFSPIDEDVKIRSGVKKVTRAFVLDVPEFPIGGLWKKGDTIINLKGEFCRCTESGTPGVWVK